MKVLCGYNHVMTFGKHKNKTVNNIMTNEPYYLEWLRKNEIMFFNPTVLSELKNKVTDTKYDFSRFNSDRIIK